VVEVGFNYRIDEPRAALAMARLDRLDADNELRAGAAAEYRERLKRFDGAVATMAPASGANSAHHLFTVVLDPELDRDGARDQLAERGIQTSLHYPPVHRLSAYGQEAGVPLTDQYSERAISLPLFPEITTEQIELVVDSLAEALV
jgi:dTDP-4-amino-4,6-dideoxygalactose transaminase